MASTNFRHNNNVQPGLDSSAAATSYLAGLGANQLNYRFELFVLSDGEKKITESVVSGTFS